MSKPRKSDSVTTAPVESETVEEAVATSELSEESTPRLFAPSATDISPVKIPESMEFPRLGFREYRSDGPLKIQLLVRPNETALVETPMAVQVSNQSVTRPVVYLIYPSLTKDEPRHSLSAFDGLWLSLSRTHPKTGKLIGKVFGPLRALSWARYEFPDQPGVRYVRYACETLPVTADSNEHLAAGKVDALSRVFGIPTVSQLRGGLPRESRLSPSRRLIPR